MEKCLTEMLIDELGEAFTVSVNTQHIDLYKKDGDGNAQTQHSNTYGFNKKRIG